MKELDSLIESTFSAKGGTSTPTSLDLISLVEATLDEVYETVVFREQDEGDVSAKKTQIKEFLLSLPKFSPNEAWGDPESVERQTVNKIFGVIGGGATIEEKLKFIQRIADPSSKITSTRRIISTLIILESLAAVVNSFSSSAAGFVFEGFLAALLRGKQESEISEKGNLPIQDLIGFSEIGGGTPISLKLLNKTTAVHGSYTNLVDALEEFGQMIYIVARKQGDEISLEEFTFTRDNFIDAISTSAKGGRTKDKNLLKLPDMTPEASIDFINGLDSWEDTYEALRLTDGYQKKDKRSAMQKLPPLSPDPDEDEEEYGQGDAEDMMDYIGDKYRDSDTGVRRAFKDIFLQVHDLLSPEDKKKAARFFRVKLDQLSESIISEGSRGGTQWGISAAQLSSLDGVDYKVLGTLPYSSDKIEKIAEMHMDKLNGSLLELFEATKALSDNINNYFTYEKRSKAIQSGETAIEDTQKIQDSLKKEISEKD